MPASKSVRLDVVEGVLGVLLRGCADARARAPRRDVQREERVELESCEVVLVADEVDQVRQVLCTR